MQSELADGLFRRNEFDEDAILFLILVLLYEQIWKNCGVSSQSISLDHFTIKRVYAAYYVINCL